MLVDHALAIGLSTVAQFITGAIWYTPLFGKLWGKIHGFDKLAKKVQLKMMSQMGPIFAMQLVVTVVTSIALVMLHNMFVDYPLYMITFWIWLGFVVPAQISGILFGGTDKKWIATKSAVMAGGSLVTLMVGTAVVKAMLG